MRGMGIGANIGYICANEYVKYKNRNVAVGPPEPGWKTKIGGIGIGAAAAGGITWHLTKDF